ncbi:MAG: retroviral-like aspartic protease family protein [Treponema sp.]|jgi:hypothetical protein|nr:retroviral-like aspartic protease family protein [Treponema sp.]
MKQFKAFTVKSNKRALAAIKTGVVVSARNGGRKEAVAVWDTGATVSRISNEVIKELGVSPFGYRYVGTANGLMKCGKYEISLYLPNSVVFQDIIVSGFSGGENIDMLIGMDIINAGDFSITNANGVTVASFRIPADTYHIDYVEMHRKSKFGRSIIDRLKKAHLKRTVG